MQFRREVQQWGAGRDTLHKVRAMQKGDVAFLKFHIPNTSETIEAKIRMSDVVALMDIGHMIVPATWKEPNKKLIDLLEKNATRNQDSSHTR